jgi:hypothetical protein
MSIKNTPTASKLQPIHFGPVSEPGNSFNLCTAFTYSSVALSGCGMRSQLPAPAIHNHPSMQKTVVSRQSISPFINLKTANPKAHEPSIGFLADMNGCWDGEIGLSWSYPLVRPPRSILPSRPLDQCGVARRGGQGWRVAPPSGLSLTAASTAAR